MGKATWPQALKSSIGAQGISDVLQAQLGDLNENLKKLAVGVQGNQQGLGAVLDILQTPVAQPLEAYGRWEPVAVLNDADVRQVIQLMQSKNVRTVFVVKGRSPTIIGMISVTQVLTELASGEDKGKRVDQSMVPLKSFHCIAIDDSVGTALEKFNDLHVKRLFVTKADKVVGILTGANLLRWLGGEILALDSIGPEEK
jgi:predicted transcriptional regulator